MYGSGSWGGRGDRKSLCICKLSCERRFNVEAGPRQIVLTCCWFSSWKLGHTFCRDAKTFWVKWWRRGSKMPGEVSLLEEINYIRSENLPAKLRAIGRREEGEGTPGGEICESSWCCSAVQRGVSGSDSSKEQQGLGVLQLQAYLCCQILGVVWQAVQRGQALNGENYLSYV